MLVDIVFLGSNLLFLLIPIGFYALNKYSAFLHIHLSQPIEDDKIFQNNKTRFQITFRLLFLCGLLLSIIYLISILFINNTIIQNSSELTQTGSVYFIFILIQIVFSFTVMNFLIFSFLYFRFKPDERHQFIKKYSTLTSSLTLISAIVNIPLYLLVIKNQALPLLISSYIKPIETHINIDFGIVALSFLVIIVSIYCFMYLKFSRKRNNVNAKLYLFLYIVVLIGITYISTNFSAKYFELFHMGITKQYLFDISTGYSGLLWVYLASLSFYSILFSIYIFINKENFIGSQFAINYVIKLSKINVYSTICLIIISLLPWFFTYYFKYI